MPPKRSSLPLKKPTKPKGKDSLSLAKARLDKRKRQSFSEFKETLDGTTYTVKDQVFNNWTSAFKFASVSGLTGKDIKVNKVVLGRIRRDDADTQVLYVDGLMVVRTAGDVVVTDYEQEADDPSGELCSVPLDFVRQCRQCKDLRESLNLHLLWVNA